MKDEQAEKFVEALKFTPMEVTVSLYGYGGEIVLGHVSQESVDYFDENDIDLDEFSTDWDNESEVPEDKQPFTPGEWHNCDDIAHEYGAEMNSSCRIVVEDENGNTIWEHNLDTAELYDSGVDYDCTTEEYASEHSGPVFKAQSTEKGCFFNATFTLRAPFDPTKLKLTGCDVEGWELCSTVEYDGEELDNDGGDTNGKGLWFEFLNTEE